MDYGPSLLKVLSNCTVDTLTHKAMQKSAEAEFVTEVFAAAAAVSRSWVSLTQSGSVSVNSDCNADILRTAKEEWLLKQWRSLSLSHMPEIYYDARQFIA